MVPAGNALEVLSRNRFQNNSMQSCLARFAKLWELYVLDIIKRKTLYTDNFSTFSP